MRKKLNNQTIDTATFERQRREQCGPILRGFHEWLEKNQGTAPASSEIAEAIYYALKERPALERYLDDW